MREMESSLNRAQIIDVAASQTLGNNNNRVEFRQLPRLHALIPVIHLVRDFNK